MPSEIEYAERSYLQWVKFSLLKIFSKELYRDLKNETKDVIIGLIRIIFTIVLIVLFPITILIVAFYDMRYWRNKFNSRSELSKRFDKLHE